MRPPGPLPNAPAKEQAHADRQRQFNQRDRQSRGADEILVVEEPKDRGANQREKEQASENRECRIELFQHDAVRLALDDQLNDDRE